MTTASMHKARGIGLTECLIATTLFTVTCLGLLSLYQHQVSVSVSLATWRVAAHAADEKVTDILMSEAGGFGALIDADTGGVAPAGSLTHSPLAQFSGLTRHWRTAPVSGIPYQDVRRFTVRMQWQVQHQTGSIARQGAVNSRPPLSMPAPRQFNPYLQ